MIELNIHQLELVSGGKKFEFGRDYIGMENVASVSAGAGAIRAATTTGAPETVLSRSGVTAARAGTFAIPVVAYNATVWVNNNTSLQENLAKIIDKVTGLDKVGSANNVGNTQSKDRSGSEYAH